MSNQLKVQVVDGKVILPDSFAGIDTVNIIASNVGLPYTATQDCYIWVSGIYGYAVLSIYIDNVVVKQTQGYGGGDPRDSMTFQVKKGQAFNATANGLTTKVFGIKY